MSRCVAIWPKPSSPSRSSQQGLRLPGSSPAGICAHLPQSRASTSHSTSHLCSTLASYWSASLSRASSSSPGASFTDTCVASSLPPSGRSRHPAEVRQRIRQVPRRNRYQVVPEGRHAAAGWRHWAVWTCGRQGEGIRTEPAPLCPHTLSRHSVVVCLRARRRAQLQQQNAILHLYDTTAYHSRTLATRERRAGQGVGRGSPTWTPRLCATTLYRAPSAPAPAPAARPRPCC